MDKSLPKDFEALDFSEDSRSRKSLRLQRNNSENGPNRVTNPGEPTPSGSAVASPTPDDVPIYLKDWEDILNSNPEDILKESSRKSETEGESELARQMIALEEKRQVIIHL